MSDNDTAPTASDEVWLNPPPLEDPNEPVIVALSRGDARMVHDHLEAHLDSEQDHPGDADTRRALLRFRADMDGAMQDPRTTELSRDATGHPANQRSRLLPTVLTMMTRWTGGIPVVAAALRYAAAIEYQRHGDHGVQQLCDHAAGAVEDARHRRYGMRAAEDLKEQYRSEGYTLANNW